ncbi:cytochrome c oxidase subunit 6B1 [Lingula anatina]|uniref:Cytochrome c oxidase subunit 6B1 n=1 Tax=Lingula anatina TaxID=7574 RepID=A0A1S3H4U3_LINAN|nr:cytochrome c oxidase subunit 6B1 [Lingula anatina]|eukprot:XP_013381150.1 cytochrome c oxidase subunit 6B1 [Lingula anatina]
MDRKVKDVLLNWDKSVPEEMMEEYKVEYKFDGVTPQPFDARFTTWNQMRLCWQNFADYQRCIKLKGKTYEPCKWFSNRYLSFCPAKKRNKLHFLVEEDAFASGKRPPPMLLEGDDGHDEH